MVSCCGELQDAPGRSSAGLDRSGPAEATNPRQASSSKLLREGVSASARSGDSDERPASGGPAPSWQGGMTELSSGTARHPHRLRSATAGPGRAAAGARSVERSAVSLAGREAVAASGRSDRAASAADRVGGVCAGAPVSPGIGSPLRAGGVVRPGIRAAVPEAGGIPSGLMADTSWSLLQLYAGGGARQSRQSLVDVAGFTIGSPTEFADIGDQDYPSGRRLNVGSR